ncbi:hypothetical protein VB796_21570 [Arcicella sp. LKC2W]|uniref:hypothetical protein n=1 Tax=Arcicella sp. LKC2W TaxID=2984198 RepID=UPI002B20EAEF|nr:hypothetical protein [Arcicella sp. LKC2W]MEA5461672.1 hypothetical protein [Arcicella sp. LKC2W]
MNQGHFFKADNETIFDVNNGIYIFRYLELCNKNKTTDIEKFPISVVFKKSTIEFNFIGKNDESRFGSFQLLTIPILQISESEISNEIIKCYERELVHNFDSSFIWDEQKKYSFSIEYDFHTQNGNDEQKHKNIRKNFYKKLLLDFIEDFYHSKVFHKSSLFLEIKSYLDSNKIFKGIYLKYDYLQKKDLFEDNHLTQIKKSYVESGIKFIEFTTDTENYKYFSKEKNKKEWLAIAEDELEEIISDKDFKELYKCEDLLDEKDKINLERKISNWLVKNYEVYRSFSFFLSTLPLKSKSIGVTVILVIIIFILAFISFSYNTLPFVLYSIILVSSIFGASILFASFFKSFAINIIMPRLQMALLTSWIAFLSTLDFWKYRFDTIFYPDGLLAGVFFLFASSLYLYFEIKRNTMLILKTYIIRKIANVIGFGFLLSLFIGLFGMSFLTRNYFTHSDFLETKIVREHINALNEYDNKKGDLEKLIKSYSKLSESPIHPLKIDEKRTLNKSKAMLIGLINNFSKIEQDTFYNDKKKLFTKIDTFSLSENKEYKVLYKYRLPLIECNLYLFPGFLFLTAAFALFSGIFLTLLFDDKPVTDPL